MTKTSNRLAAVGWLLCAAGATGAWASPVPSGAMADYHLQCNWGETYSEAGCAALADRLEAIENPSRDEWLALVLSSNSGAPGGACAGVRAVVADHPDYAEALYRLAYCVDDGEAVALLRRALEIEPDNYGALRYLLRMIEHFLPPEMIYEIDPGTLAAYREARYEAAREREAWEAAAAAADSKDASPRMMVWSGVFSAASGLVNAALREGDLDAAEAVRARVRRDVGLDELDYSVADNVTLACRAVFVGGEFCAAAVERSAEHAVGVPLSDTVLAATEVATERLRRLACATSKGARPFGMLFLHPGECLPEITETPAVRRLRAVLENHGGPRSSEHHRVLAQGFLDGKYRIDGLREALRLDAGNDRARCELATALAGRGDAEGAAALGGDPECLKRGDFAWGDVGSIRPDPGLPAD